MNLVAKTTKPRAILSALKNNDLDLIEYVEQIAAFVEATDSSVQAFLSEPDRSERLKAEAKKLIDLYPSPGERPELFGLLIGIKDIFHVDGFATKAGSNLPAEDLGGKQSSAVTKLKEHGALVLGKTVTTEFAYFAPGPTKNPHNLEHTPGGSSSGSAAAVAAGMVPVALGTQTIGSVTRPASFCGVIGYKPSYGRISKEGVIPLSTSLDHVGFFAPDLFIAQDVAQMLVEDWTIQETLRAQPRIGIPGISYLNKADAEMQKRFDEVCKQLEEAGYEVVRSSMLENIDDVLERHQIILAAEAAKTHQVWFETHKDRYHSKTKELIQKGQKVSTADLEEALTGLSQLRNEIMEEMDTQGIDLWVSPSAPGPAPKGIDSTGNPIMNLPWTHAGLPTLNIPYGFSANGLPLGLQVAAGWQRDEQLFAWASNIQMAIQSK